MHGCDAQEAKMQDNIRLHPASLYIYFVLLSASANEKKFAPHVQIS